MAKVTVIYEGWCFVLDCGHTTTGRMSPDARAIGDEVDCPQCAEIKAGRVEALKEMRQELVHVTALELSENWRIIQNTFDGIFDKLIEATR